MSVFSLTENNLLTTVKRNKQTENERIGIRDNEVKMEFDDKMMANAARFLAVDAIEKAKSGHPGVALGMADIAEVLFTKFLKYNPKNPDWADRDRVVLSSGHASSLLYAVMYLCGYSDITLDDIKAFRQVGSKTAGHPEADKIKGIEASTGPLGQGVAMSVGMAVAEKILAAKFGSDIVNHYTYVLCGDGCLMEGVSEEAISLAGNLGLNKLIFLWDDNKITIDGDTSLATCVNQPERFKACGWNVLQADGHNHEEIAKVIEQARKSDKPVLIDFKTVIGYGAPTKAGSEKSHGSPLGAEETAGLRQNLKWDYEPFEVPAEIKKAWEQKGVEGAKEEENWQKRFNALPDKLKSDFDNGINDKLPDEFFAAMQSLKEECAKTKEPLATRKSFTKILKETLPFVPQIISGSADLSESNGVWVKEYHKNISAKDFTGNFIHYGIREHAMGAAVNGMVLHKGVIPFSATFFSFADYMLPTLRMAALMKLPSIFIFSHDSFAVGEDGPTHQPVEQLSMLRNMPNLRVFRPADTVEAAECWEFILSHRDLPAVLLLTRQNLEQFRSDVSENLSAKGGYVASPAKGVRQATIVATGSEVSLAIKAQQLLASQGKDVAVVSVPCKELFEAQSDEYRKSVIGDAPVVVVEAAKISNWEKYIGNDGDSVGMTGFGMSGPYKELTEIFGFTPENVAEKVSAAMDKKVRKS